MAKKALSLDGLIHFGAVKLRVVGSGNLRQTLYSLDDVNSYTAPVIAMAATTNREPLVLTNFIEQRAYLEFKTTAINETFVVDSIRVYVKLVGTGYPQ